MDREEAKLLFTIFLVALLLSVLRTAAQEDGSGSGGTQSTADVCRVVHEVAVHNSSEGVKVQHSSITSSTTEHSIVALLGLYIPEVCGHDDRRCNIKVFERNSREVYCVIPVRNSTNNGTVIMKFRYNDEMDLEYEDYFFITNSQNCIPTQTFVTEDSIIVQCLHLSPESGYVQFFPLRFSDINDISTAFFDDGTTPSERIYSPETLSSFVLGVDHRRRCGSRDNIYFVDDSFVIYYAADKRQFELPYPSLPDCDMHSGVEYYDNDKLIIRCSNDSAIELDPCNGIGVDQYTTSTTGLPYPCPNSDTLVLLKDGKLNVTNSTNNITVIDLPSANIELAACFGESDPAFVFTLKNGSTYALWLADEYLQYLVDSSHTHYYQVFSGDTATNNAIGITTESDLVIVNLTCGYSPVSQQLPLQFHPSMLTLFLGRSTHSCECAESLDPPTELPPTELPPTEPPTELPPTELPPTEPPTKPPTKPTSATTDPELTQATVPQVESSDKDSETFTIYHIVGIVIAVVILITFAICAILGSRYVWKKCRQTGDYSIFQSIFGSRRSSISVESSSTSRTGQQKSELQSLRGESPNDEVKVDGASSVDDPPEIQTKPPPPVDTKETSTITCSSSLRATKHADTSTQTSDEDQSHSANDQPRSKAFQAQGAIPWPGCSEPPTLELADSTLCMTPITESGRGERDVAVSHHIAMPPDTFHPTAVVQQTHHRTETQEQRNDFTSKRNAFLSGAHNYSS